MNHATQSTTTMTPAHLLSLYGLKWNPFASGVPVEGLYCSPRLYAFGRRSEMYLRDGGFAMLTGAPGGGKSWALRILDDRLSRMRDVVVRSIDHPQSGVSDFYRELGDLFSVSLTPRNRWGGFKAIREKWQAHVDATLIRPVLVIDEAQEMPSVVLNESDITLPDLLTETGRALVLQLSILGQVRTAELLAAHGLEARVVDYSFFPFGEVFESHAPQIARVEELSDAHHLAVGGDNVMIAYLLEIGRAAGG